MFEIIFSSSYDEKNPPHNIFTNNNKKFFTSIGLFPREIFIQFSNPKPVSSVGITSSE